MWVAATWKLEPCQTPGPRSEGVSAALAPATVGRCSLACYHEPCFRLFTLEQQICVEDTVSLSLLLRGRDPCGPGPTGGSPPGFGDLKCLLRVWSPSFLSGIWRLFVLIFDSAALSPRPAPPSLPQSKSKQCWRELGPFLGSVVPVLAGKVLV